MTDYSDTKVIVAFDSKVLLVELRPGATLGILHIRHSVDMSPYVM